MANADRPCGFRPYGPVRKAIKFTSGAAIYTGDAVKLSSDGFIDPAAAQEAILGVALEYASAAGEAVMVSVDPMQLYVVQASGSDFGAAGDVGNTAELLATAGDSTVKLSRHELDSATKATQAQQLIVVGLEPRPDNAWGANADLIVRINEHQLKEGFAGV